ncbi:MAG: tRNA pseudouridine(55) synthase TruB [Candidatus Pacebacteria bacterium]|nr:tRNA pseudouridine(55) synthase TruB [Candidatus Paceibacterota bacterium]
MEVEGQLLLIDKPKGITSFDVIRRLRRQLGIKKMGHAGTLDPLATGLMIIGVGAGTKKLTELVKLDKEYIADVLIGERRTTGDMEGEVVEEKEVVVEAAEILRSKISAALANMLGELTLPVSAYSAIKVDGVPMYKRARKAEKSGEVVSDVPVRKMRVDEVELLDVQVGGGRAVAKIRFAVGSGTYIRSLAEELGRRLFYPATLQDLRRTKIGEFNIRNAKRIEEIS